MALSADRELDYFASPELIELPVDAAAVIYKGALVGRNRASGNVRCLVAGDEFVGVAFAHVDNSAGTAAAKRVRLHQNIDIVHAMSGVAAADIGRPAYATDDSTLTTSPIGTTRIGRVVSVDASNVARVRCAPLAGMAGLLEGFSVTQLADAGATLSLDHMNRVLLIGNTAARTIVLPACSACRPGAWFAIVKTTAAAFAVTLDGNSTELIDGSATFAAIDAQYDTALLVTNGTEWIILARDIS